MSMVIQVIDHRRQGSRLARAGRPGDQHQPTGHIGNLAKHFIHTKIVQAQDFRWNSPQHRADAPILVERVDPKARHTGHLEREVEFQQFLEIRPLLVVHDVVNQLMNLLVVQRWQINPPHITIKPDHRWQASGKVQVGRPLPDAEGQQLSDIHSAPQFQ